jgi:hypothetical protein
MTAIRTDHGPDLFFSEIESPHRSEAIRCSRDIDQIPATHDNDAIPIRCSVRSAVPRDSTRNVFDAKSFNFVRALSRTDEEWV